MLALREAVRDLPPDPEWSERLARYQNAIDRILARGQRFEDAQVRQVFQALTSARQSLTERLLVAGPSGASTFQTFQMGELQRAIDLAAGDLARTFGPALGRMLADAWQAGIDFTPEALQAIDVSLAITGRLDTSQLVLLQQESAALVSDVSDTFRQQARRELLRGVLAGASVHEVTRNVADLLRTQPRKGGRGRVGIAARAEMIVRTEINAASAIANELRQRQIVETVPEMHKYWRSARDPRVRPDHLAADRRYRPQEDGAGPIPFNDDYVVGAHKGKFPHDPRLPASEVVNCRCVSILYKREWFEDDTEPAAPLPPLGQFENLEQAARWAKGAYPDIEWDFDGAHIDTINPTLVQFDKLAKEYPGAAANLGYVGTYKKRGQTDSAFGNNGAIAHASFGTRDQRNGRIGLNPEYYGKPDKFREAVQRGEQSGWFPKGVNSFEAIITHEFGHVVHGWLLSQPSTAFHKVVRISGLGLIGDTTRFWLESHKRTKALSQYSLTNDNESWAEGFASLYFTPKRQWIKRVRDQRAFLDMVADTSRWLKQGEWQWHTDLPFDERAPAYREIDALARKIGVTRG